MVSIIIVYYDIVILGPPPYMRSVVDRNVAMRRMTVKQTQHVWHSQYSPWCSACCGANGATKYRNSKSTSVSTGNRDRSAYL